MVLQQDVPQTAPERPHLNREPPLRQTWKLSPPNINKASLKHNTQHLGPTASMTLNSNSSIKD